MSKITGWTKVSEKPQEVVWVNQKRKLRVVAAKGNNSWQVWYEKNIGRVASDESFITNAFVGALLDKRGAIKVATDWMRMNP